MIDILGVQIKGIVKPLKRLNTGLHSFDHSFINSDGDVGFPLGKMVELFGPPGVGKSTTAYGLAGLIANKIGGNITLCDLEDFDPKFLATILSTVGFKGVVDSILEEKDEKTFDRLVDNFWSKDEEYSVGILDAIGTVSPVSERTGDHGEANMGRRAKLIAQLSRKAIYALRASKDYKTLFLINHLHPRIGGIAKGNIAPGGKTKEYLSSIRIQIKRRYRKKKEEKFPDGSYVIEGKVVKNKWGLEDKIFYLFVLSGQGMHPGLTAMYDAVELGLMERKNTIKIGNKSYGYIKDVIQEARNGNDEFFQPFFDLLEEHDNEQRNNGDTSIEKE